MLLHFPTPLPSTFPLHVCNLQPKAIVNIVSQFFSYFFLKHIRVCPLIYRSPMSFHRHHNTFYTKWKLQTDLFLNQQNTHQKENFYVNTNHFLMPFITQVCSDFSFYSLFYYANALLLFQFQSQLLTRKKRKTIKLIYILPACILIQFYFL